MFWKSIFMEMMPIKYTVKKIQDAVVQEAEKKDIIIYTPAVETAKKAQTLFKPRKPKKFVHEMCRPEKPLERRFFFVVRFLYRPFPFVYFLS